MTGTFQINKPVVGQTTVAFTYYAETTKVSEIIGNAALILHSRGLGPTRIVDPETGQTEPIPLAELSNQQKLNMVDDYVYQTIRGLARQARLDTAINDARDGVLAAPDQDEFEGRAI